MTGSDEALMGRVQADDTEAFAELYDRHSGRALRVARAVCRDAGRSEDAVQDAFLSIWRTRSTFRPATGSFQAWAMKIVQHRAIDSARREASRPGPGRLDTSVPDSVSRSVQDDVVERSEAEALRASLDSLPPAQAEVVALAFFGGLTHSQIADQLELPAGTVKGRMRLGLHKLRGQFEADG